MKKFIKLPNSIESVEEKLAMTALLMSAKNDDETITSVAHLEVLLTKISKPNRKTLSTLFTGLKILDNKEIIKIKDMPNKTNDFFEVIINAQEETFTILYYEEIQLIMSGNYKGAVNRDLLSYYSTLASFYNNKTKVAYPSIEQLSEKAKIHTNTIDRYNKVLKELDIIHIENNGLIKNADGIQSLRNTYSRKEDAELCKMEAENYRYKIAKSAKGKLVERKAKENLQQQVEVPEVVEENVMDYTQNVVEDSIQGLEDSSDDININLQQNGFGITELNMQPFYIDPSELVQEIPDTEFDRMKSFD